MGYPINIDEYTDNDLLNELQERAVRRQYGLCDYCNRLRDEGQCKFPNRHRLAMTAHEAEAARLRRPSTPPDYPRDGSREI